MRLKKLELFGFKSFSEPTELFFPEGITAIVGPNGCGKSNIIDAIRWVMGETSAKGLRGDSMEDVIFSGSESRRPLNLCEVTLTLTGAEGHLPDRFGSFHEVAITRRLQRSGESEYLINRIPCRLKDITELFMDTGVGRRAYSVVEQGRIDAILSAKPAERRSLIEEAAGITKYKSRKEEASRKMEETSQNLQRLADVIGEVRREMNGLKRQAARAEEFKGTRSERKSLERDLLVWSWLGLAGDLDASSHTAASAEREAVEARARADRLGARLEEGRLALLEEERAVESRQRSVYQVRGEISSRESRSEFLRREVAGLAERGARAEQEAAELAGRREKLAAELSELTAELAEVEGRLAGSRQEAEALRAAHAAAGSGLAETEKALDLQKRAVLSVLGDLNRVSHALDHAMRQEADGRRRLDGMGRQEAEVALRLAEIDAELGRRESELAAAEAGRVEVQGERQETEELLKSLRGERQRAAACFETARAQLQGDQSRLKALEQIKDSLEWYGAGVRAILREAKQSGRNGVHGVVADTITACPEYESALEAALGERLQYVIVESADRGVEAVRQLKSQRAGRSSFAPVGLRRAFQPVFPAAGEEGVRGPLLDLVEVAPDYRGLAGCLLGDVLVVETLEHALRLWEKNGIRATLVTLEGDTLSPDGVISGGAVKQDGAGLLQKNRQIRELRETVARRTGEVAALQGELSALELRLEEAAGRFESAREELHRRELQVAHLGKDLAQLKERRERLQERREALEFEREDLSTQLARAGEERAGLAKEKDRRLREQEEAEGRHGALQGALEAARERLREADGALTQARVNEAADQQRTHGLGERLRSVRASQESLVSRDQRLRAEIAEAAEAGDQRRRELLSVDRELAAQRVDLEEQEARLSALLQALCGRRGGLTEEEREAGQARRAAEEAQRRLNEAQLGLRDLELRAESLRGRFQDRQLGDLEEAARSGLPEGFQVARAEGRIRDLDGRISAFGEINLLAIEEYEDRKTRYAFLEAQRVDLEESLESLRQAILRINRVSRDRFGETFERVNATFRELFPKIFRGGEAWLVLSDPENLLDTGVDIVARPPGKKPQHISLLSGGEKALTAVALIFSIFLVKPSPFCILDEVDAPLDEANIGRFTEMVRSLSSTSQFLVITHNKSTMEGADHLYGVTMSEPGVSRAVSVKLRQEEAEQAEAA